MKIIYAFAVVLLLAALVEESVQRATSWKNCDCPYNIYPVCGDNGVIYRNKCIMKKCGEPGVEAVSVFRCDKKIQSLARALKNHFGKVVPVFFQNSRDELDDLIEDAQEDNDNE